MIMRTLLPSLLLAVVLLGAAQAPTGTTAAQAPQGTAAAPSTAASASGTSVPGQLRFERFNRAYTDITPEIDPVSQGPLTVRLSAPRSNMVVRNHLLRLEPGVGGSHSAELRVEFQGKGWLVADVDVAGMASRLQDEVVVPPQALNVQGRVRITRDPNAYVITPEQLPKRVRVRIQSGIATDVVGACRGVAVLAGIDCGGVQQALSTAVVPLPPPGESYLLEDAELTAAERRQLDSYLASAGSGRR